MADIRVGVDCLRTVPSRCGAERDYVTGGDAEKVHQPSNSSPDLRLTPTRVTVVQRLMHGQLQLIVVAGSTSESRPVGTPLMEPAYTLSALRTVDERDPSVVGPGLVEPLLFGLAVGIVFVPLVRQEAV